MEQIQPKFTRSEKRWVHLFFELFRLQANYEYYRDVNVINFLKNFMVIINKMNLKRIWLSFHRIKLSSQLASNVEIPEAEQKVHNLVLFLQFLVEKYQYIEKQAAFYKILLLAQSRMLLSGTKQVAPRTQDKTRLGQQKLLGLIGIWRFLVKQVSCSKSLSGAFSTLQQLSLGDLKEGLITMQKRNKAKAKKIACLKISGIMATKLSFWMYLSLEVLAQKELAGGKDRVSSLPVSVPKNTKEPTLKECFEEWRNIAIQSKWRELRELKLGLLLKYQHKKDLYLAFRKYHSKVFGVADQFHPEEDTSQKENLHIKKMTDSKRVASISARIIHQLLTQKYLDSIRWGYQNLKKNLQVNRKISKAFNGFAILLSKTIKKRENLLTKSSFQELIFHKRRAQGCEIIGKYCSKKIRNNLRLAFRSLKISAISARTQAVRNQISTQEHVKPMVNLQSSSARINGLVIANQAVISAKMEKSIQKLDKELVKTVRTTQLLNVLRRAAEDEILAKAQAFRKWYIGDDEDIHRHSFKSRLALIQKLIDLKQNQENLVAQMNTLADAPNVETGQQGQEVETHSEKILSSSQVNQEMGIQYFIYVENRNVELRQRLTRQEENRSLLKKHYALQKKQLEDTIQALEKQHDNLVNFNKTYTPGLFDREIVQLPSGVLTPKSFLSNILTHPISHSSLLKSLRGRGNSI